MLLPTKRLKVQKKQIKFRLMGSPKFLKFRYIQEVVDILRDHIIKYQLVQKEQ